MAINFAKPDTADNYSTVFVPGIRDNVIALSQWLDSIQTTITGAPPVYAKRINRSSRLVEEYDGTSWVSFSLGYMSKSGDSATGTITSTGADGLFNSTGAGVKPSVRLTQASFAAWSMENPASQTYIQWQESGTTKLRLYQTGALETQGLVSRLGGNEGFRVVSDGGFFSAYNTANNIRSGYLQFNAVGSGAVLMYELDGSLTFGTNNVSRWGINSTTLYPVLDNTYSVGTGSLHASNVFTVAVTRNSSGALTVGSTHASGTVSFISNNILRGNISAAGNWGFGAVSTDAYKVEITGNAALLGPNTLARYYVISNTSGVLLFGSDNSSGGGLFTGSSAYAGVIGTQSNTRFQIASNNIVRMTLAETGYFAFNATPVSGIMVRFQDPGFNDVGVELARTNSTTVFLQAYNRTSAIYNALTFDGSLLIFNVAGTGRAQFNTSGHFVPIASLTNDVGSNSFEWRVFYGSSLQRASAGTLEINSSNAAGLISFRTAGAERLEIAANGRAKFSGGAYTVVNSQTVTANPTFDASASNAFEFTAALDRNIASCTITNAVAGQTIYIRVLQGASTAYTFAAPAGAKISGSISTVLSSPNILTMTYSAMSSRWEGGWLNLPA